VGLPVTAAQDTTPADFSTGEQIYAPERSMRSAPFVQGPLRKEPLSVLSKASAGTASTLAFGDR